MARRVLALTIFALLSGGIFAQAEAISATCLPGGYPTTTTPPVFSAVVPSYPNSYPIDVWRLPCQDGSGFTALLLRAYPIATSAAFVCTPNFKFIQNGVQINAGLQIAPGGTSTFCDDLVVPTTFALEALINQPAFDKRGAFTLFISSVPDVFLEIPAGQGSPQFGIAVVATGCTTCQVGQLAQFHMHVTNPGAPITVEVKTAIHFPGGAVATLLGLFVLDTFETGEFDVPIISIIVPGDAPKGAYTLEVALLDPITGETLARNSRQATVQ
jgi:hypothetical protein